MGSAWEALGDVLVAATRSAKSVKTRASKTKAKGTSKPATSKRGPLEVYEVKEKVRKSWKQTDSYVKHNPWRSVGIAALVGALFAKLFWRRKR